MNLTKISRNHVIVVFALLFLIVTKLFSRQLYFVIQPNYFLFIHTILETFSIIVSAAIAFQCIVTYQYTKSQRRLFLGVIFLIVAWIDLMHTLTYQGMPFMGLAHNGARATYFWLIARITEAVGLVLYMVNWIPGKKISYLILSLFYLTTSAVVLIWGASLPALLNANSGVMPLKIAIEYVICFFDVIAILMLATNSAIIETEESKYLMNAVFLILFSEIIFTFYKNVYGVDNFLGHIYKALGYIYLLKSILINHIKQPFLREKLSQDRFDKVFQFAPVGLAIIDKSNYAFLAANRYLQNYVDIPLDVIIGKSPLELGFPEEEWLRFLHHFQEANAREQAPTSAQNIEITLGAKEGSDSVALISLEIIEFKAQECFLISVTDITELKKLQNEMIRLDCLNMVGQMAAGIGHEVRNPMTTVRGYLQLLQSKLNNERFNPTIGLMIDELDRANSIISEFLTLARNKKAEFLSSNLNDVVNRVYPLIEADTFTQNKQIRFIAGEIPSIHLNPKEITQLVLNLCRNGLEAMEEGKCLTIRTYLNKLKVILSIEDQGHGIPGELIQKLGDPFFSTKENGTGLGLAICQRIADSHNANIKVESSPSGTTFTVSFPIPTPVLEESGAV